MDKISVSSELAGKLRACCVQADTGKINHSWTIGQFLAMEFKPDDSLIVQQSLIKNVRLYGPDVAEVLKDLGYQGTMDDSDHVYGLVYVLVRLWQHNREAIDQ